MIDEDVEQAMQLIDTALRADVKSPRAMFLDNVDTEEMKTYFKSWIHILDKQLEEAKRLKSTEVVEHWWGTLY